MRQHWIASVRDSINEYHEVQSAYFDGTQVQADQYFRSRCKAISHYFGNERYQISMIPNAIVLQEGAGNDI